MLRILNSQSRQKEEFKPLAANGKDVGFMCGPTVYDSMHLGMRARRSHRMWCGGILNTKVQREVSFELHGYRRQDHQAIYGIENRLAAVD
jgi:hypothetical protein